MSQQEPESPYVYQPYGSVEGRGERLWGVAGVSLSTTIMGLTKDEADAVATCLQQPPPTDRDIEAAVEACEDVMVYLDCNGMSVWPIRTVLDALKEAQKDIAGYKENEDYYVEALEDD